MSAVVVVSPPSESEPQPQPQQSDADPTIVEIAREQGEQTAKQDQQTDQIETIQQQQQTEQSEIQILTSRMGGLESQVGELSTKLDLMLEAWEAADQDETETEAEIEVIEAAPDNPGPARRSALYRAIFGTPRN